MKTLAQAILKAMDLREESFDHKKADTLEKTAFPNFYTCYRLSLGEAAELASKEHPELAEIVNILISNSWEEAQHWANKILLAEKP